MTPPHRIITLRSIVLATVALCVAGCSRPATEITGTVTLDGAAIPDATLDFVPPPVSER